MSGLRPSMRLDIRLQARNKLYHIGLGLALVLGVVGRTVFEPATLGLILPVFYLLFLGSTTYMFGASMVILERGEQTLNATRVTPLRTSEYLSSKVLTLSVFALIESAIILFIALGPRGFNPVMLVLGIFALGIFYSLLGLAQVAPHESVTDFLLPGATVVSVVLQLPIFYVIDVWPGRLWYLVPTMAPLVLMEGAFRTLATWEWIYAIGYGTLASVIAYRFARRRFAKHLGMDR